MRELVLPTGSHSVARAGARRPAEIATRVLDHASRWLEVRRQRRDLLRLSDAMLRDIGISRADAEREAARPFWDV